MFMTWKMFILSTVIYILKYMESYWIKWTNLLKNKDKKCTSNWQFREISEYLKYHVDDLKKSILTTLAYILIIYVQLLELHGQNCQKIERCFKE